MNAWRTEARSQPIGVSCFADNIDSRMQLGVRVQKEKAMYYAIQLKGQYNGKSFEGLYAGKNEHGQEQLAVHPDDEFMQYVRLEGAQHAASYISDFYTKKIVDPEGKFIASFNRVKKTWVKQTEVATV